MIYGLCFCLCVALRCHKFHPVFYPSKGLCETISNRENIYKARKPSGSADPDNSHFPSIFSFLCPVPRVNSYKAHYLPPTFHYQLSPTSCLTFDRLITPHRVPSVHPHLERWLQKQRHSNGVPRNSSRTTAPLKTLRF